MIKDTTPNFEGSPIELLQAKVAYHKQQIKQHTDQMRHTQALINQLKDGVSIDKESAHSNVMKRQPIDRVVQSTTLFVVYPRDFSVTYWKPKVEEHLKSVGTPQKTEEILSALAPNNDYTADEKRKAIGAISSSLFALVQTKKVEKLESTGRGYAYKYKFKNMSLTDLDDLDDDMRDLLYGPGSGINKADR